jgi:hypothetical protein
VQSRTIGLADDFLYAGNAIDHPEINEHDLAVQSRRRNALVLERDERRVRRSARFIE